MNQYSNTYFSTFISGLGEVISEAIEKELPRVKILHCFDGLIAYQTDLDFRKVRLIRFLNNSYALLSTSKGPLDNLIDLVLHDTDLSKKVRSFLPDKRQGFRIVFSKSNDIQQIDEAKTVSLERKLINPLLFVNRTKPQLEFLFLERSEGNSYFGLRLTRQKIKKLHAGQLRPELANLLCQLSDPEPTDFFLDPFAGYGSIPVERATFPYRRILAGEIDQNLVELLAKETKRLGKYFKVTRLDARNIQLDNESIDKIVTDPPWGLYDKNSSIETLYPAMLGEFIRVLRPEGIIVLLLESREFHPSQLKLVAKYEILVSGNKAAIYKFKK